MNILKERAKETAYLFLNFLLTQEQRKKKSFSGFWRFFVDIQPSV